MITPKLAFRILPWFLLVVIVFILYMTNYDLFSNKGDKVEVINSSVILKEIERMGKLELVKYKLSEGKIIGSSILKIHDYSPDLNVILVASGEAVGCIDLTKMEVSDISIEKDTVLILLPPPELCYHKLDLENTRIYSLKNNSWWSKLFSDNIEDEEIVQMAYRETEKRIEQAAYESGILIATNEQATLMLEPLLKTLSGKNVKVITGIPGPTLDYNY